LSDYKEPFEPLAKLDIERIFRGEEVGKSAVAGVDGAYPMLLGGLSIARYRVSWDGSRISNVRKPLEWYEGRKILIQKSAPRIVAALDDGKVEGGFVVPQSVYCIKTGRVAPFYLLAILNSSFMGDYVYRMFTGYKMLQPQIELEDIKRLPIRKIERRMRETECQSLVDEGQLILNAALRDGVLNDEQWRTFTEQRMNRPYPQEEVLHDLLVRLGRAMTAVASETPEDENEKDLLSLRSKAVQKAVDMVVYRLYEVPISYQFF
jgi:hypothetical protein